MSIYGTSIKVSAHEQPRVVNYSAAQQWAYIDGTVPVFCDTPATADRISRAFAELAEAMRATADLTPEPVDALVEVGS